MESDFVEGWAVLDTVLDYDGEAPSALPTRVWKESDGE